MKFLVTTENRESYWLLPIEKRAELFMATDAYIRKFLKSGKCKGVFYTSGFRRSVSIWELESAAETTQLLLENPMLGFQDIESEALVEHEVAAKALMANLKKSGKK
jgi:muconolactone delta-isomerase